MTVLAWLIGALLAVQPPASLQAQVGNVAIAYKQSVSTTTASSGATLAKAYTANLTAGSLLVAVVYWQSGTATCAVSDSVNGSWTAIGSPQRGTGGLAGYSMQLFYRLNTVGGGKPTVTMTVSASVSDKGIAIHEYVGIAASSALEASMYSGQTTGSGNTIATGSSISTTNANDLLFCGAIAGTTVSAAGAGWTLRESASFTSNGTEDRIVSSAGSYSGSFTDSTSGDIAMMVLVAFSDTPL